MVNIGSLSDCNTSYFIFFNFSTIIAFNNLVFQYVDVCEMYFLSLMAISGQLDALNITSQKIFQISYQLNLLSPSSESDQTKILHLSRNWTSSTASSGSRSVQRMAFWGFVRPKYTNHPRFQMPRDFLQYTNHENRNIKIIKTMITFWNIIIITCFFF